MSTLSQEASAINLSSLATPALFVLIWSTGFIVAKYGLPYAPPLTFLVLRFAAVLAILLPILLLTKAKWPSGNSALHISVSGVLLQAGYLIGVWCAIQRGLPGAVAALITGMQPVTTAVAGSLIGEKLFRRQWIGLLLGLVGVGLVLERGFHAEGVAVGGVVLCLMALFSMTAGTLYQKRYCPKFDLRTGMAIQYAASLIVVVPAAIWFEGLDFSFRAVNWTSGFVASLAWSVLALSIGAIFLLFALISRKAATRVSSLFFLTPPTTAIMAWLLFGEAINGAGIAGMALAAFGVSLAAAG